MARIQGNLFDEHLVGTNDADEIFGSWGADTIEGFGGADMLDGQEGNDTLFGGGGNDTLFGDRGILGGGSDELHGGSGNDTLHGGNERDFLFGDDDNDTLFGEEGDDELDGGAGDDILRGGIGNDLVIGGSGADDLDGGQGDDDLRGGSGGDTIVDLFGFDKILGGSGSDTIIVDGGGGEIFLYDEIDAGSGNDTIVVGDSKIIAFGGADNDTIATDANINQVLSGGVGDDTFKLLNRGLADSVLLPFDRRDIAEIHGDDVILVDTDSSLKNGFASVQSGVNSGVDMLDLSLLRFDEGVLTGLSGTFVQAMTVDLAGGLLSYEALDVSSGETFSADLAKLFNIENVRGSEAADAIIGNGAGNELSGGGGDDLIRGRAGDDFLFGGDGEDRLFGDENNDFLSGGANDDELNGGAGTDTLIGGEGADELFGGGDADDLSGGDGADTLSGGSGSDLLAGGRGADTLTGGSGGDTFKFAQTETAMQAVTDVFGNRYFFNLDVFDRITDFDPAGVTRAGFNRDMIDVAFLLDNETSFAGTTAQEALAQGYIYFVQHGAPGQADFGTKIMIDLNGGNHSPFNDIAIADLIGVAQNQLNATHFIV